MGVAPAAMMQMRPGISGSAVVRGDGRAAVRAEGPSLDGLLDRFGARGGGALAARLGALQLPGRDAGRIGTEMRAVSSPAVMTGAVRTGVANSAAIDLRAAGAGVVLSGPGGAARLLGLRTGAVKAEAPRVGSGWLGPRESGRLPAVAAVGSSPRSAETSSAVAPSARPVAIGGAGLGDMELSAGGSRIGLAPISVARTGAGLMAGRADPVRPVQGDRRDPVFDRGAGRLGEGWRIGRSMVSGAPGDVVGSALGGAAATVGGRLRSMADGPIGSVSPGGGLRNDAVPGAVGNLSDGWAGRGPVFPAGAAAPAASGSGGGGGAVMLDGRLVGRWIADRMGREAERAPAGMTRFDARQSAAWRSSSAM